jgi:hypothetical protein
MAANSMGQLIRISLTSEGAFCQAGENFLFSTINWRVQKYAWSENRLSFSAAYSRGNQLNEQKLMVFNMNPNTFIFDWCKVFSKIVICKGVNIQLKNYKEYFLHPV